VDLFLRHFGRRARGMVSQGERPINYNQYKVPLIEKLVKLGDPRCRVGRHRRYRGARHRSSRFAHFVEAHARDGKQGLHRL
jgi:hypothetical protein